MAMAVLLGLGGLTLWGCRRSARAFRRAQETALLVRAEHDAVRFHYPTRRDGRAVDVDVPADDLSQAAWPRAVGAERSHTANGAVADAQRRR